MLNREKIIRELQHIDDEMVRHEGGAMLVSCDLFHMILSNAISLLHEHDPVEVEIESGGSTYFYVCGECHTSVAQNSKYCRECGRRLKWNDRN